VVIALYVSGHGYGHSVRAAEVARALLRRGARVVVRTDAPRWLYPEEASYAPMRVDIGVIQDGGLDMDIGATRAAWTEFAGELEQRAHAEADWLREQRADIVLGDIPPLAFAAAARAGLPSVAMANFTWDWIYAEWPDFEPIVDCIRDGYSHADLLLRLPLHSEDDDAFVPFRCIEAVPFVARIAQQSRAAVRAEHGLPMSARVVLLSFGGFNAPGLDVAAFGEWDRYLFVTTPPITVSPAELPANLVVLKHQPADYVSFLAACDAVITKPGYGIVADCLANHVAALYTERGPFREYPVLAAALERLGNARHIGNAALLAGNVGASLDALFDQPRPRTWTKLCMDGADVVADRVLAHLGTSSR
jgi:L-arabinokinase